VDRKRGVRYKQKFRCQIVERMNACENIQRLSRELGIHRRLLYKWRDQVDPADAEAERDVVLRNPRNPHFARKALSLSGYLRTRQLRWIFSEVPCKK